MNKRLLDMSLGFGVALVWGLGLVFAKADPEHFPPILLMAFRFAVTTGALVWFAKPIPGQYRTLLLISFISATLQYSLTFTGLDGLDARLRLSAFTKKIAIANKESIICGWNLIKNSTKKSSNFVKN